MFSWLWQLLSRKAPPRSPILVDDAGVSAPNPGGNPIIVRWVELAKVAVVTTDHGPFLEDVFYELMTGKAEGCRIGQLEEQGSGLVDRLFRLPGFDSGRFVEAMCSTDNVRFVCWQRKSE